MKLDILMKKSYHVLIAWNHMLIHIFVNFFTGESEDEAILMFRTAYDLNVEGMVILENQILTDLYNTKLDIDYSKVAYPNIICPMNMVCITCISTPLTVNAQMDSLLWFDTLNKGWSIEYIEEPYFIIPK